MKPCQKVAVLVSYDQLTEKIVREVERHTPRHLRAQPWGEHMYSDVPQIFVHFPVLSRLLRKEKTKIEEEVLQVSPGRHGCIRIRSVSMCVACASRNRKSTCESPAHPHVFVFVICRSRNLSTVTALQTVTVLYGITFTFQSAWFGRCFLLERLAWKMLSVVLTFTHTGPILK